MKTSFDISEPLLREVKALAKQRGTTTRSLVEQALIKLLDDAAQQRGRFVLRDASFGHGGLRPEFEGASWEQIRDEIYSLPSAGAGE